MKKLYLIRQKTFALFCEFYCQNKNKLWRKFFGFRKEENNYYYFRFSKKEIDFLKKSFLVFQEIVKILNKGVE